MYIQIVNIRKTNIGPTLSAHLCMVDVANRETIWSANIE